MSPTAVASPEYDVIIGTAPMMTATKDAGACASLLAALGTEKLEAVEPVFIPESLWGRIKAGAEGAVAALSVHEDVSLREVEAALAETGLGVEVIYSVESDVAVVKHLVFGLHGAVALRNQVLRKLASVESIMLELLHA
ncbi:MAG: hypothetical protein Q3962_09460 [Corynebacterium sp.]|nr:hypothetical protein [Corynebacterium sp.]